MHSFNSSRQAETRASTPFNGEAIVALSANVLPIHLAECREAGMDDHIAKPISPAELLTKIARWTAPNRFSEEANMVVA